MEEGAVATSDAATPILSAASRHDTPNSFTHPSPPTQRSPSPVAASSENLLQPATRADSARASSNDDSDANAATTYGTRSRRARGGPRINYADEEGDILDAQLARARPDMPYIWRPAIWRPRLFQMTSAGSSCDFPGRLGPDARLQVVVCCRDRTLRIVRKASPPLAQRIRAHGHSGLG